MLQRNLSPLNVLFILCILFAKDAVAPVSPARLARHAIRRRSYTLVPTKPLPLKSLPPRDTIDTPIHTGPILPIQHGSDFRQEPTEERTEERTEESTEESTDTEKAETFTYRVTEICQHTDSVIRRMIHCLNYTGKMCLIDGRFVVRCYFV